MDNKEILNILDTIEVDENEFDSIDLELNDIEKKRIKRSYKKAIKSKGSAVKKVAMVAGLTLAIGAGSIMATPVMASNVPVLGRIYEMLGVYDEYIDYTKYIGQSIDVEGGKYTIEEIMVTPNESLIAIRITGDEPIAEDSLGFMVGTSIGGAQWDGARVSNYRIDEYNVVQVMRHSYSSKVPEKSTIKINVHEMSSEESPSTFGNGSFEIKVDFGKSYEKFTTLKIEDTTIEKYGFKIDKINSSILGTEIIGDINLKGKSEEECLESISKLEFILNVDGKMYSSFEGSASANKVGNRVKGNKKTSISEVDFDMINSAKDVSVMVFEGAYSLEDRRALYGGEIEKSLREKNEAKSNIIVDNGVTYKRSIEFIDGHIGEFYKMDRTDNSIKFYYKGNAGDIVPLFRSEINTGEDNNVKRLSPKVYRNGEKSDEFIVEFNNIEKELDVNFVFNYDMDELNAYSFIEEVKVK